MGRKAISDELYSRLVTEYRANPDHPYTVAKQAGCDPRTAIRAWERGWPRKHMEPISTVMQREQQKARAIMIAAAAAKKATAMKEREDAVEASAKTRAEEGQIVRLVRGAALQQLSIAVGLVPSARKLAAAVTVKIDALASLPATDPHSISASSGIALLQRVADLSARINENARTALEMERLHMGQPTQILGLITSQSEMTIEEAATRIEMAQKALDSGRRAGGLTILEGGLKEPAIGKRVTV